MISIWNSIDLNEILEVLVLGLVHLVIPRVPSDVVEHVQREREVEAFFIGQSGRGIKGKESEKCESYESSEKTWRIHFDMVSLKSGHQAKVAWLHLRRPLNANLRQKVELPPSKNGRKKAMHSGCLMIIVMVDSL